MPDLGGQLRSLRTRATADTASDLGELDDAELETIAPLIERRGVHLELGPMRELFESIPQDLDQPASDRWLAPRVHATLRLTRAEAADRGIWWFLAGVPFREYVVWRWAGDDGTVAGDRWGGPIHKQAIARLWWGAELLRNATDYSPVEQFFDNQDLPNSYLHRPFVRVRPVALGILRALQHAAEGGSGPTSKQINRVAAMVNLATAARSMDAATATYRPRIEDYLAWVAEAPTTFDPSKDPVGPGDGSVPPELIEVGSVLGREILELAATADP